MSIDWTTIISSVIALFAGGGIWGVIQTREAKKKTPYDMLMEMMAEQKKFYEERNAEYEREKLDSAEKSMVLTATHKCAHRFKDPTIPCPVEEANEERLKNRCERCKYNDGTEDNKEPV